MYARAVDDAATRIRDLRHEEWEDLGLAGIALGLAIAATEARPALALPLFVGGLVAWALGIRALWRRWDLVDRLAGERDAYVIPEVRKYALRETSMERRRGLAAYVRRALQESSLAHEARVTAVADELEALASELEDEELALDPACAVACARLLSDVAESPLLNRDVPAGVLRLRVCQIRSGFAPRRVAA
jgi:hypothetical protein